MKANHSQGINKMLRMTNNISFIFYFFCYYLHCDDIVCMHHYICVKSKPLIHLVFLWNSTTTLQYKYIIMCIFFLILQ